MFGFGLKYRTDVIVQIHAILKLVPRLKSLLNTIPTLKRWRADSALREQMPFHERQQYRLTSKVGDK